MGYETQKPLRNSNLNVERNYGQNNHTIKIKSIQKIQLWKVNPFFMARFDLSSTLPIEGHGIVNAT